jgi:hypothetical protein
MDLIDEAMEELRFLLDRGYRKDDASRFVSDTHHLNPTERNILFCRTFSREDVEKTMSKIKPIEYVRGQLLMVDGFDVLTTVQDIISGAKMLACQDGIIRKSSIFDSSYIIRDSTRDAADRAIEVLASYPPRNVSWVFDSQIIGSSALAEYVREKLEEKNIRGESITLPSVYNHILKNNILTATSDINIIGQISQIVDIPAAAKSQAIR